MQSFISKYDEEDIAAISLDVNSTSLWTISPPSLRKFKDDLNKNATIKFRYSISVSRQTNDKSSEIIETNQIFYLSEKDLARQEITKILNRNDQTQKVHLPYLFPKFLKVCNQNKNSVAMKFV